MPGRRVIQSHTNMGRNSLGNIENLWSSPVKTMRMKIPEVFFHEYVREHTEHTEISIWIAVVHQSELRWFLGMIPDVYPSKTNSWWNQPQQHQWKSWAKNQHLGDPPWVTLLFLLPKKHLGSHRFSWWICRIPIPVGEVPSMVSWWWIPNLSPLIGYRHWDQRQSDPALSPMRSGWWIPTLW